MDRRSFLKRSLAIGAGLALPELIVPERRFWQGTSIAKAEPVITILGPAPTHAATLFDVDGSIIHLYDYIAVEQELMWVKGFDLRGDPIVVRNILNGEQSESTIRLSTPVRR